MRFQGFAPPTHKPPPRCAPPSPSPLPSLQPWPWCHRPRRHSPSLCPSLTPQKNPHTPPPSLCPPSPSPSSPHVAAVAMQPDRHPPFLAPPPPFLAAVTMLPSPKTSPLFAPPSPPKKPAHTTAFSVPPLSLPLLPHVAAVAMQPDRHPPFPPPPSLQL